MATPLKLIIHCTGSCFLWLTNLTIISAGQWLRTFIAMGCNKTYMLVELTCIVPQRNERLILLLVSMLFSSVLLLTGYHNCQMQGSY